MGVNRIIFSIFIIIISSIKLHAQSTPTILFPQNTYVSDINSIRITWKDTAQVFDLQWGTNPSLAGATNVNGITNKYYDLNFLPFNVRYYFRVRRAGGSWTSIYHFFILDINSLTSLRHWWDAGTGITVSGNKITAWQDRISNVTGVPPFAANQPEVTDTFLHSGLPLIRFGGSTGTSDHYLLLDSTISLNTSNFSIVSNYKLLSVGNLVDYILAGNSEGLFVGGALGGFNSIGIFKNSNTFRANESTAYLPWCTYSIFFNDFFRNSLQLATTGTTSPSFNIYSIGARSDFGGLSMHGNVGDIMLFDTELNDSVRTIVENYQKWRWLEYPNLGNDTAVCETQWLLKVPTPNVYSSILWSTGATDVTQIVVNTSGTYWVRVTGMGVTLTDTIRISGIQAPKSIYPQNDTIICLGDTITLNIGTPDPSNSYVWNTGAVNDSIRITQPGIYFFSEFVSSSGCTVYSDTIEIRNVAEANFISNAGCVGQITSFVDNSISYSGFINSWKWDFGDLSTNADTANGFFVTYEYPVAGNFEVVLMVSDTNGCVDTSRQIINIKDKPLSNFTYNKECLFEQIQFSNLSTAPNPLAITSYKWYFSPVDSSLNVNPTRTFSVMGLYPVTLVVTANNGCKDTYSDTLFIDKFVNASFSLSNDSLCLGSTQTLNDLSTYNNTSPNAWQWTVNGGAIGNTTTVNHTFNNSGMNQVRLFVTSVDNCSDSAVSQVFIKPPPVPSFTVNQQVGFPPLNATFTNTSSPDAINFLWDLGNGTQTTNPNPVTIYSDTGYYEVSLTVTDGLGCMDSISLPILVVRPSYNVILQNLICTESNGYMQFTPTLFNQSNIELTEIDFYAGMDNVLQLFDSWSGNLAIGQQLVYPLNGELLLLPEAKICCVEARRVGSVLSDSLIYQRLCVPLTNEFSVLEVYPNPSEGQVNLFYVLPVSETIQVNITDINGKIHQEKSLNGESGVNLLQLDLTGYAAGNYFITVFYNDQRVTRKLVIDGF